MDLTTSHGSSEVKRRRAKKVGVTPTLSATPKRTRSSSSVELFPHPCVEHVITAPSPYNCLQYHSSEVINNKILPLIEVREEKMGFKFSAQKGSRLTILRLPHTPPLFNKLSFDNGIEYERIKLVLEKYCSKLINVNLCAHVPLLIPDTFVGRAENELVTEWRGFPLLEALSRFTMRPFDYLSLFTQAAWTLYIMKEQLGSLDHLETLTASSFVVDEAPFHGLFKFSIVGFTRKLGNEISVKLQTRLRLTFANWTPLSPALSSPLPSRSPRLHPQKATTIVETRLLVAQAIERVFEILFGSNGEHRSFGPLIVESIDEEERIYWKEMQEVDVLARKMKDKWSEFLGKETDGALPLSAFVNAISHVGDILEVDDTGQSLRSSMNSPVEVYVQDTSSTVREYVQWVSAVDALRDTINVNLNTDDGSREMEGYGESALKRESLKRQISALDHRPHPSNSNYMLEGNFLIPTIEMMASEDDMEGVTSEIANSSRSSTFMDCDTDPSSTPPYVEVEVVDDEEEAPLRRTQNWKNHHTSISAVQQRLLELSKIASSAIDKIISTMPEKTALSASGSPPEDTLMSLSVSTPTASATTSVTFSTSSTPSSSTITSPNATLSSSHPNSASTVYSSDERSSIASRRQRRKSATPSPDMDSLMDPKRGRWSERLATKQAITTSLAETSISSSASPPLSNNAASKEEAPNTSINTPLPSSLPTFSNGVSSKIITSNASSNGANVDHLATSSLLPVSFTQNRQYMDAIEDENDDLKEMIRSLESKLLSSNGTGRAEKLQSTRSKTQSNPKLQSNPNSIKSQSNPIKSQSNPIKSQESSFSSSPSSSSSSSTKSRKPSPPAHSLLLPSSMKGNRRMRANGGVIRVGIVHRALSSIASLPLPSPPSSPLPDDATKDLPAKKSRIPKKKALRPNSKKTTSSPSSPSSSRSSSSRSASSSTSLPPPSLHSLATQALHAFELIPSLSKTLMLLEERQDTSTENNVKPLNGGDRLSNGETRLTITNDRVDSKEESSSANSDLYNGASPPSSSSPHQQGQHNQYNWRSGPEPLAVARPWPQLSASKIRLLKKQQSESDLAKRAPIEQLKQDSSQSSREGIDTMETTSSGGISSFDNISSGGASNTSTMALSSTTSSTTSSNSDVLGSSHSEVKDANKSTKSIKSSPSQSAQPITSPSTHTYSEDEDDVNWMKVEYLLGDSSCVGIRPSNLPVPFAGLGVFALEPLEQGRTITWYDGPRVTAEVPMPQNCKTHLHSTHLGSAPIALDGLRYPLLSRGTASLINSVKGKKLYTHPNVKLDVISSKLRLSYIIRVRTLANIAPGEELFAGYSWI